MSNTFSKMNSITDYYVFLVECDVSTPDQLLFLSTRIIKNNLPSKYHKSREWEWDASDGTLSVWSEPDRADAPFIYTASKKVKSIITEIATRMSKGEA